MSRPAGPSDLVVVGAGVIGLAVAWRACRQGLSVTLVDPAPAGGATHVAAGMLAPVSEVRYGETDLLRLAVESLRRYPDFVAGLERATGHVVGLRRDGTLVVGVDVGDRALLDELADFHTRLGLTTRRLTGRECREVEPALGPAVRCGLQVADDHSVDNRRLAAALLAACRGAGVDLVASRAAELATSADGAAAAGVVLDSGQRVAAQAVVLAAGAWSATLPGLPPDVVPPVRPVKGQLLRLHGTRYAPPPRHTVRATVSGTETYLVPRADGELIVGATVEEQGFDTAVTAGAVHALLRDARLVVPALDEMTVTETLAGLRPGTPDNAPLVGATELDGLLLATGHYRNGVLLAPVTADIVVGLVTATLAADEPLQALAGSVDPRRTRRPAGTGVLT